MGLTSEFEKILRKKFIGTSDRSSSKSILVERVLIPLLTKISGVEDYENRAKKFDTKNIVRQEDLQDMFKDLGLRVRLHWNVPPGKQSTFVFNHPTGILEGLFVQQVVQNFNLNGKLLGDEMMSALEIIKDVYIPLSVRAVSDGSKLGQLRNLKREIKLGQSLIIFPSGSVSKKDFLEDKLVEYEWQTGFLELSKSNSLDIIPCYIDAQLSLRFYILKHIYKDAASLTLFKECISFLKRNNGSTINIYIGDPIHHETFDISEETASKFQSICEDLKFKLYNNKIVKP